MYEIYPTQIHGGREKGVEVAVLCHLQILRSSSPYQHQMKTFGVLVAFLYSLKSPICEDNQFTGPCLAGKGGCTLWLFGSKVSECIPDQPLFFGKSVIPRMII